jgi:hypothetical protein
MNYLYYKLYYKLYCINKKLNKKIYSNYGFLGDAVVPVHNLPTVYPHIPSLATLSLITSISEGENCNIVAKTGISA